MTKNEFLLGYGFLLALSINAQSVPSLKTGQILPGGWFPCEMVLGDVSKPWMVLEKHGPDYRLRKLRSIRMKAKSNQPESGECRIDLSNWRDVIALFQGVETINPKGKLQAAKMPTTAWSSTIHPSVSTFGCRYRGAPLTLNQSHQKCESWDSFSFEITYRDITQTFYEGTADWGFTQWSVRFIGDLDGDGSPDLILSTNGSKGGIFTILFLSTFAQPGDLLGYAADFSDYWD